MSELYGNELYRRLKILLSKQNFLGWNFPKDREVLELALHNCSWDLFLEKYAFYLMYRRDKCDEDRDVNRFLNRILPSGKTLALLVVKELSKKSDISRVCKNKLRFLDNLSKVYGQRCRSVKLVNSTNISVHLGMASVLENVGLYAERVTGLPVVPGTALKGVLSAWANWEENEKSGSLPADDTKFKKLRKEYDKDIASKIFGDDSPDGSTQAGQIVFVGGFPEQPPELDLDIVNPHHDKDGGDLERLTPNPFLCVKPGVIWRFVFYVRAGSENEKELLDTTERWLKEALTQYGIGAKTSAGYGKFREPTQTDIKNAEDNEKESDDKTHERKPAVRTENKAPVVISQPTSKALSNDYPNEKMFKNLVLNILNSPNIDHLKGEIMKLQKPENSQWLERLKKEIKSKKDIKKKLQTKDWFPKEWLQ